VDRQSIAHFAAASSSKAHRAQLGPSTGLAGSGDVGAHQEAGRLIAELQSRRRILDWSVADVAARSGIDASALNQWEGGSAVPRFDAVQRWAAALGLHFTLVPAAKDARERLQVDWPGRRVTLDGTPVRLTPMEWRALERLARAPGELVTHRVLFHHLYGEERDYRAQSTAIRVLITKLRRLLPLRIEARWGKGYVLTGLTPSQPAPDDERASAGDEAVASGSAAVTAKGDQAAPAAVSPARPEVGAGLSVIARSKLPVAAPPTRRTACRNEELGVIERFLAERGVTRCPDVATIERSPLPTLVWDKVKRKWVRPSPTSREAV
jgi:transcriptional regulator with XRE-family HTH domain